MRKMLPTLTACALGIGLLAPISANSAEPVQREAAAAAKKSPKRVTLKLAKKKANVAEKVSATIAVTPAAKRTVEIQMSSETNTWNTVAKVRTNASGKVKTPIMALKDGKWKVRAVVGSKKSKSSPLKAGYPAFGGLPEEKLNPVKPGKLTVKKTGTYQAGEFMVTLSKTGVTVKDGAGRTAWQSASGKSFVTANRSLLTWVQRATAGAYWAQVKRFAKLTDQSVTRVRTSGSKVTFYGVVSGGGKKAAYKFTMQPQQRPGGVNVLQMNVTFPGKKGVKPNSVQLTSGRSAGAGIHGFGNQCQDFDLSGQVLPLLVQEQGITRGEEPAAKAVDGAEWAAGTLQTSYGGWPTYVTSQLRSFALADNLDSGAFSIADMRRAKQVSLELFAKKMTAEVVARDTPQDLLKARAAGSSRPELADWVQRGAVLGIQGGTDKVRKIVADMQADGAKISGVWLQDWVGKRVTGFGEQLWWTWQLNKKTYPNWDQMVADFNAQDIAVTTYINPFVINQDEVDGVPIRNFYKEGEQKGYLVKNQRGKTYVVETIGFPTALVDLTNPDARDWYADIIATELLGVGAVGFMADFGEYTPFDAVLKKGSAAKQHSRWPQLWAKTVAEGCERGGVPDCMAFFRSSYLGTPKNAPLMWAGDQMVNFAEEDGMANAVKCMLAGGVSGAPLWHSDIGGYTSINAGISDFIRPPDLNARWAEMQAFGPVMRTHETNRPKLNEQVYDTPETRKRFAKMTKIYAALYDYRKTVIDEAVDDGVPAMRHTWLVYPGSKAAESELQFFLGDHLFMAPVHKEGATSVEVTFPPGSWKHILTGEVFAGDSTKTVNAPIGTPAAFVKVGDPVGDQILNAIAGAGL